MKTLKISLIYIIYRVQPHIKWYDALIISIKNLSSNIIEILIKINYSHNFLEYVLANYPTGLNWNFKGTADFNALLEDLKNTEQAAAQVKTEAVVPSRAALFSQINQGSDVTSSKIRKN